MDSVTVVSLAASLGQLFAQTTSALQWLNDIQDATGDRTALVLELTSLLVSLTNLRFHVEKAKSESPWFAAVRLLRVEDGILSQLESAISSIERRLQPKISIWGSKPVLQWPYARLEVQTLLESIGRAKSIINLAVEKGPSELYRAIELGRSPSKDTAKEAETTVEKVQPKREIQTKTPPDRDRVHKSKERNRIIQWASPLNFIRVQDYVFGKRQAGTCEWLLNSSTYEKWANARGGLLWCSGLPGAGKTVFTSAALNSLRQSFGANQSLATAVVYCSYKKTYQQTLSNLLAAIWCQLVQQGRANRPLSKSMILSYKTHTDRHTALQASEMSAELQSEVRRFQKTYILIDALDECAEPIRTQLIQELGILLPHANLMFTSRFDESIKAELSEALHLEVQASPDDIAKYLRGLIASDKRLRWSMEKAPALCDRIVTKISTNATKSFLLPQMQMDYFARQEDQSEAFKRLPEELDELYREAFSQIESNSESDRDLGLKIISIIYSACRPLTRRELQHALAIGKGDLDMEHEKILDAETLVSICANLISIDGVSDEVAPIHYTAQEHFERIRKIEFASAYQLMAGTCLAYLSSYRANDSFNMKLPCHFKTYATDFWTEHYHLCRSVHPDTDQLLFELLRLPDHVVRTRLAVDPPSPASWIPRGSNGLQIAILLGSHELVQKLARQKGHLNYQNENGSTALHLAARPADEKLLATLLEHKPDVNIADKLGFTPVLTAVSFGNYSSVNLLFRHGARDWRDKSSRGLLHHAAASGHVTLVQELLADYPGKLYEIDNSGRTPLFYAVQSGNAEVVSFLLRKGADVNKMDVDKRFDMELKQRRGRQPLHVAAEDGNANIIEALLKKNPDLNARDGDGFTPLRIAVASNNLATAGMLLKAGCDYDEESLHIAARQKHRMMELLLDSCPGIDINSKDKNGNSSLCIAATQPEILNVILRMRPKVKVNQPNNYKKSPLHLATEAGCYESVTILLEARAHIEHINHYGETPLHRAAENGFVAILQVLLSTGANINALDNDKETPLHRAVAQQETETVRLLLQHRSLDCKIKDSKGVTPLQLAIKIQNPVILALFPPKDVQAETQHARYAGSTEKASQSWYPEKSARVEEKYTERIISDSSSYIEKPRFSISKSIDSFQSEESFQPSGAGHVHASSASSNPRRHSTMKNWFRSTFRI